MLTSFIPELLFHQFPAKFWYKFPYNEIFILLNFCQKLKKCLLWRHDIQPEKICSTLYCTVYTEKYLLQNLTNCFISFFYGSKFYLINWKKLIKFKFQSKNYRKKATLMNPEKLKQRIHQFCQCRVWCFWLLSPNKRSNQ